MVIGYGKEKKRRGAVTNKSASFKTGVLRATNLRKIDKGQPGREETRGKKRKEKKRKENRGGNKQTNLIIWL